MSRHAEQDMSFIAQALPAFVSEAHEQVETLEQLLLQLEAEPGSRELLDALFRCVHTVKGSAGIFGLDAIVAFTHHVETLMDLLREGRQLGRHRDQGGTEFIERGSVRFYLVHEFGDGAAACADPTKNTMS